MPRSAWNTHSQKRLKGEKNEMQLMERIKKEMGEIDRARLSEPFSDGNPARPNRTMIGELPLELRQLLLLKWDYEARIKSILDGMDEEIAGIDSKSAASKRREELLVECIALSVIGEVIDKLFWAELRLAIPEIAGKAIIGIAGNWQIYWDDPDVCPDYSDKHPLPGVFAGQPLEDLLRSLLIMKPYSALRRRR